VSVARERKGFEEFCSTKWLHALEILSLEGEGINKKWTIFLRYFLGKFIMLLPSAARLGRLLQNFFDSIKWVSLVLSANFNTIVFWPF
jgi:hypothetical protein